ncbi:hypothetical protein AL546_009260 [Vibrio vulnificus]|uniref:hypothetical protein n=1 Tax=Vibrio TaxID=662 RepID=UPI000735963D|nr:MULTISPECIES: hypothetical protein [Vibrio]EGQ7944357.1 hypothetical protein [Vibrio cholerae]EJA3105525.1 hypothetical protein [Vibrio vulnificus]EKF9070912.1 hypothetical protein [Vibrio cholerae]EKF9596262.1 hypothetical protein [Vibrio cholerae]MBO1386636.1 hypothetical protein [Vibrio cholerae]
MTRVEFFHAIKKKRLEQLSLEELAYAHLSDSNFTETNHGLLTSSLSTVLREIRHVKWQTYGNSFLPLSAAFTVLDQLGYCYQNAELPEFSNQKASSIKKSLYYFCGFGENDTDTQTLVALRNSFLHTASGLSKAQFTNQPNHMFVFNPEADELITYPAEVWDGNFANLTNAHSTFVNQKKLIAMVEEAVEKAQSLLYAKKLVVSLPEGCPEFYYRFLKHIEQ